MRSYRRVTLRVAPALASLASVLLFATCDFDKISGTPTPLSQSDIDRLFSITPADTTVILGGTTTLGIAPGANVDLTGTTKVWSSSAPTVVSINAESGVATGVAVGNAVITARLLAPELDTGYSKTRALRVRYKGIKACGIAPQCSPSSLDSIAGLNLSRPFNFFGTNNSDVRQTTALTGVTVSTHDSAATTSTVVSVTGSSVFARKNGAAYVVGVFENMRDSIKVRVRQVAKSLTFPTTDYTANAINVNRTLPIVLRDISDSVMTSSPVMRWRSSDATVVTIDSMTGVLRVLKKDTARIFVRVDTVNRSQKLVVSQALASLTKFAGDAQTDTVALPAAILPTVTALDSGSTPIANLEVTFRRGLGLNASITDSVVFTDADGRATLGSWKLGDSAGVGINTVIATAGSLTTTFTATTVAGAPKRLGFAVHPVGATVNTNIAPGIQVQVQDSLGNPVTTATNAVTLSISNNAGGATLSGTLTVNAVAGVATFAAVQLSALGSGYTLEAASGALQSAISNAFDIYGPKTKVAFTTQPVSTTVNATMAPVRVTIQDASGLRVTSSTDSVFLAIGTNAGSGTLGGTLRTRATDGIATFSDLTLNAQGSGYTLAATATGLTGATSSAFNITGVGPATKLGFLAQPTNVTAGASIAPSITVQVQDANGNPVTTSTQQITLSIESTSPSGATLGGTLSQNAVNGVATFNNISINKAGNGYKLLATATGTTFNTATSTSFNVNAGAANKLAFFQQPTHTVAGQNISPAVVVEVQDAAGNRVTTGGFSVTLALASCTATLTGNAPQTTSNGTTTFSVLNIGTQASNCTLTAAATGLTGITSTAFNIVAATGAAMKLAFTGQPASSVGAGQQLNASGVRVSVQDAAGTTVTTASVFITITIEANPGGALINNNATLISATSSSGVATFSNLFLDKVGTGYTIKASATGYAPIISSSFAVTPAAATRVGFLTQPATLTAGTPFSPAISAAVQDQFGNTVTGATNTITIGVTHSSLNIPFSTGQNQVSVNAANGLVTFSGLTINKAASGARLFISSTNLTGALSQTFDILTGPLAGLGFSVQPQSSMTSGAVMSPAVQVQAQDAVGNAIADFTNPISVALTGGTAGAILGGTKTVTPTAGVSSFTNLSVDKAGAGYQLSASASGVSNGTSSTFAVIPGAASKLTWLDHPTATFLNAPLSTTAQQPRIAIQDAQGNTVTTNNSTVRLTVNTGPSSTFRNGFNSTTFDFTPSAGVLTLPTSVNMLTAGNYTLLATAPFSGGTISQAVSNAFSVGAFGPKSKLSWNNHPIDGTYNVRLTGVSGVTPNVFVLDQWNNLVTDATDAVTITIDNTANPSATLSGGASSAAAGGGASFANLTVNGTGSGFKLLAAASGLTSALSNAFAITSPGQVTTTGFFMNDMVRVGDTLYFTHSNALKMVHVTGGTVTTITASANANRITTDGGGYVYWAENNSNAGDACIKRLQVSNRGITTPTCGLTNLNPTDASRIFSDGIRVYFIARNVAGSALAVRSVPVGGGPVADLFSVANLNQYPHFTLSGSFLYVYDVPNGVIKRMTTTGASQTAITFGGTSAGYLVVSSGGTLIFNDNASSNVRTVANASTTGAVTPTFQFSNGGSVRDMIIDGGNLYLQNDAIIRRYDAAALSNTPAVMSTSAENFPRSVQVDGVDLYFVDNFGRITKIAK